MEEKSKEKRRTRKRIDPQWITHSIVVIVADVIVVLFSYFAALWIRFDLQFGKIPEEYLSTYLRIMPAWCVITIVVFFLFKLYHSIWTYVSMDEAFVMVKAYLVLAICYILSKYLMKN